MANPKNKKSPISRSMLVRVAKIHVLIGVFFVAQIILYDSGKLITPEIVLKRWLMTGLFVGVAAVVWYLARLNNSTVVIRNLTWLLVASDLAVASFYTYTGRGFASKAIILFVLPILVAAVLQRKGAIYLVGLMSAVVYTSTAVAYFVLNFNEGYKLELYGEIGFYSALLLAISGMVWALVRNYKK